MSLTLLNASIRNYVDVYIEVYLPARVIVLDPRIARRWPEKPAPPRKRAARLFHGGIDIAALSGGLVQSPKLAVQVARPKFTLTYDPSGCTIGYTIDQVRAEQRIPLHELFVLALDENAGNREATWRLTAGNVDGVASGSFKATVANPLEAAELVPELLPPKADGAKYRA